MKFEIHFCLKSLEWCSKLIKRSVLIFSIWTFWKKIWTTVNVWSFWQCIDFTHLVVLHVFVGSVLQQHHGGLHVVHRCGPVQSRLSCRERRKVRDDYQTARHTGRPLYERWRGLYDDSILVSVPESSVALASAWQLISSSTIPSTANRAARISGVVPSCMRASRSVARFRIKICKDTWVFS